jgi:hypothetical protein
MPSCSPAVPPPPVAGAPFGVLLSAGTGVLPGRVGAVVAFGCADPRAVAVDEALEDAADDDLPVAVDEARPVGTGAEAFPEWPVVPEWPAVVAGEGVALPVCVLVDAGGGELICGAVLPEELVHAQTSATTRNARVALLTAVSFALAAVPGVIMRTSMKPPYMRRARRYS